jgi:benzoate/toluate 1,2-dioxygenase beta subunit
MRATERSGSATQYAEDFDGGAGADKPRPPLAVADIAPDVQMAVERFLYRQAEILDDRRWDEWLALFTETGRYWAPVTEQQTEMEGAPSIFYEDVDLMRVRAKRVSHPRAWSQRPQHRTSHVVSNVIVETYDARTGDVVVRSKFHMAEFRRDQLRYFSGKYRHTLKKTAAGYRIELQRVDLVNGDGTYDYVIQTWL